MQPFRVVLARHKHANRTTSAVVRTHRNENLYICRTDCMQNIVAVTQSSSLCVCVFECAMPQKEQQRTKKTVAIKYYAIALKPIRQN